MHPYSIAAIAVNFRRAASHAVCEQGPMQISIKDLMHTAFPFDVFFKWCREPRQLLLRGTYLEIFVLLDMRIQALGAVGSSPMERLLTQPAEPR